MTQHFACPCLGAQVELTEERRQHILARHPEFLPDHPDWLRGTIRDPELVLFRRGSLRERMLIRWYPHGTGGWYVVVIVVSDRWPVARNWVVTAYVARNLPCGDVAWERS